MSGERKHARVWVGHKLLLLVYFWGGKPRKSVGGKQASAGSVVPEWAGGEDEGSGSWLSLPLLDSEADSVECIAAVPPLAAAAPPPLRWAAPT